METIELSGIIGMCGLAALAANFIVGICIWLKASYQLPYSFTFLQLHKLTGYSAAITILLHIVLIPFDPKSGFTGATCACPLGHNVNQWPTLLGRWHSILLAR